MKKAARVPITPKSVPEKSEQSKMERKAYVLAQIMVAAVATVAMVPITAVGAKLWVWLASQAVLQSLSVSWSQAFSGSAAVGIVVLFGLLLHGICEILWKD